MAGTLVLPLTVNNVRRSVTFDYRIMKNSWKIILIIGVAAAITAAAFWFVCYENKSNPDISFCCDSKTMMTSGIAPHHDLASSMIDEFYQTLNLKNKKIETFIILSPNHANIGNTPVITSLVDRQTAQGAVDVDAELFGRLKSFGFVSVDEKNIALEHGVAVHLPFIKKYFPDARVVPLAFSTKIKTAESFELAQALKKILEDENVFLLASLDFSHYLSLTTAQAKDAETMAAMKNFDYEKIASFGSDNVDSPQALITFLRAMELSGAKNIIELAHKSSSDFLAGAVENVTSYFCWWFGR